MTFPVYDVLLLTGKPSTASLHLQAAASVLEQDIITAGAMPTQGQVNTRLAAFAASTDPLVIDVETWFDVSSVGAAQAAAAKYAQLIQMVRVTCPNARIGYYSIPPGTGGAGDPAGAAYNAALLPYVDFLTPSCYTGVGPSDDAGYQTTWVNAVTSLVSVYRGVAGGKPIYPFIWPQYAYGGANGLELISSDFWRVQLETLKAISDGLMLWGGLVYSGPTLTGYRAWNANDPWWIMTQIKQSVWNAPRVLRRHRR